MRATVWILGMLLMYVTAAGYAAMVPGAIRMWASDAHVVTESVRTISIAMAAVGFVCSAYGMIAWKHNGKRPKWLLIMCFCCGYAAVIGVNIALMLAPEVLGKVFSSFDRFWLTLVFSMPLMLAMAEITKPKDNPDIFSSVS